MSSVNARHPSTTQLPAPRVVDIVWLHLREHNNGLKFIGLILIEIRIADTAFLERLDSVVRQLECEVEGLISGAESLLGHKRHEVELNQAFSGLHTSLLSHYTSFHRNFPFTIHHTLSTF